MTALDPSDADIILRVTPIQLVQLRSGAVKIAAIMDWLGGKSGNWRNPQEMTEVRAMLLTLMAVCERAEAAKKAEGV